MSYFKSIKNSIKEGSFLSKLLHFIIAVLYKIINLGLIRISLNYLLTDRRKIKKFAEKIPLIDNSFEKLGNYYLPKENDLDSNSNFIFWGTVMGPLEKKNRVRT